MAQAMLGAMYCQPHVPHGIVETRAPEVPRNVGVPHDIVIGCKLFEMVGTNLRWCYLDRFENKAVAHQHVLVVVHLKSSDSRWLLGLPFPQMTIV
jgi:hypothetical protein